MASVQFVGAAREVTGSCHLLRVGDRQVLLDCGIHQGGDDTRRLKRERFAFDPRAIDAVVLSHAHLDHSGLLPRLVHQGFEGPIYCTQGTRNLLKILLEDAARIYFHDLEYDNLQRRREGRKPLPAMYDERDVAAVLRQCRSHHYGEQKEILPWLRLRFYDAGHILGSAIVELVLESEGGEKTLVFSGDLGNPRTSLMRHYQTVPHADLVLLESTYGDRDHRDMAQTLDEFKAILRQAEQDGGNVLIPAFAVGRTQELLFHLGMFHQQGLLDRWRVCLDSPMGRAVTEIYSHSLAQLDQQDVEAMQRDGSSLAGFLPNLTITESVEDSIALNRVEQGLIIIAGSGMCTGGRIRHHFKHRLWNPRNHVVFVGFQAEGTLGRLLVRGADRVKLFRQWIAVKARIHTLGGFSAHAGQSDLLAWVGAIGGSPAVCLVHGEIASMEVLRQVLEERQGAKVSMPAPGEVIEF